MFVFGYYGVCFWVPSCLFLDINHNLSMKSYLQNIQAFRKFIVEATTRGVL